MNKLILKILTFLSLNLVFNYINYVKQIYKKHNNLLNKLGFLR